MSIKQVKKDSNEYSDLSFADLSDFRSVFKELDNETVYDWAKSLGVEWSENDNPGIDRMRVSMALQRHYFPENFRPKDAKKRVKYGDLSTSRLEKLAKDNNIKVPRHNEEAVHRLTLISELKRHRVGVPDTDE